ncbi:MAG: hypothetical protein ACO3VB_08350 [Opitutales bacterium]
MKDYSKRPTTLKEVSGQSSSIEEFGLLLRDWVHHVVRGDVSNRPALHQSIRETPSSLRKRFYQGDVADAYLAAYAEWISDQAGIPRPNWVKQKNRSLQDPWFSDNARSSLLVSTPASFRQRGIFTIPENVVRLRRGRPSVSAEQKNRKARERDRRYRNKIREKLAKLKQLEDSGLL